MYFDLPSNQNSIEIIYSVITFSADGDLIIGTNLDDALLVINSNKTSTNLYPGLIKPFARFMAWGLNSNLYYIKEFTVLVVKEV